MSSDHVEARYYELLQAGLIEPVEPGTPIGDLAVVHEPEAGTAMGPPAPYSPPSPPPLTQGPRMRVMGWRVQPVLFRDDGTDDGLVEWEAPSQVIPARNVGAFFSGGHLVMLENLRPQVER
jgi:hypothetical protein